MIWILPISSRLALRANALVVEPKSNNDFWLLIVRAYTDVPAIRGVVRYASPRKGAVDYGEVAGLTLGVDRCRSAL